VQVLVDAPVWLDYFAGVHTQETDLLDRLLGRSALAVADLSLAEVLYAMREERHRRAAEAALRKLWQVDLGGFDLAVKSAIHYNSLLAKGIEVHGADCLLATYCLEHGMALLTDPPTAEPFVRHLGLRVPSVW
jgi:predicted nucleic acid-binding protein